jgi:hypothetical protein
MIGLAASILGSKMFVELGVQYPIRNRHLQVVDQAALAKIISWISPGKQLIQHVFLYSNHDYSSNFIR